VAIAAGCTGATDSVTVTGAGAIAGAGAVTGVGAGTGASDLPEPGAAEAQFAIVRFDDPELELPLRLGQGAAPMYHGQAPQVKRPRRMYGAAMVLAPGGLRGECSQPLDSRARRKLAAN
jgi:hypothetical protein